MRDYKDVKGLSYVDYKGDFKLPKVVYRVKFSKVSTEHENDPVRTREVIGNCTLPKVGEQLLLLSEPLGKSLEKEDGLPFRSINTSPIQEIWKEGRITYLRTENSIYTIEVLSIL